MDRLPVNVGPTSDQRSRIRSHFGSAHLGALVVVVALFSLTRGALAQECTTTICSGDPCTITGTHTLSNPCTLDFGHKNVTVGGTATLQCIDEAGDINIIAGDLTVKGTIKATGGCIDIRLTGNGSTTFGRFTAASSGLITASDSGISGGEVDITTQSTGSVTVQDNARVRANGLGFVDICIGSRNSAGACDNTGSGAITISSAATDGLPEISAQTGGAITMVGGSINISNSATGLNVSNGDAGMFAGDIELVAPGAGDVSVTGKLHANDTATNGEGGSVSLIARGNHRVSVSGTLEAQGGSGGTPCSSSGPCDGNIVVGNNSITANTTDPGCTVSISGTVNSRGATGTGFNEFWYRGSYSSSSAAQILAGGSSFAANNIDCRSTNGASCDSAPSLGGTYVPSPDILPQPLGSCTGGCQ